METLTINQDYVSSYSKQLGEPDWLTDLRLQAFAKLEDLPMPKPDKTKSINGILQILKNILLRVQN